MEKYNCTLWLYTEKNGRRFDSHQPFSHDDFNNPWAAASEEIDKFKKECQEKYGHQNPVIFDETNEKEGWRVFRIQINDLEKTVMGRALRVIQK